MTDYEVKVVAEDLHHLREAWNESVEDSSLRRSSTILRILLVDKAYRRAWWSVGLRGEPRVRAIDLKSFLEATQLPRDHIGVAVAAGGTFGGAEVALVLLHKGDDSANKAPTGAERYLAQFPVSRFLESPSVVSNGVTIVRRQVIQYFANKMGGAHIDTVRDPQKDRAWMALDAAMGHTVFDKPAPFFELLSIGQALAHSEDTDRFLSLVAKFAAP